MRSISKLARKQYTSSKRKINRCVALNLLHGIPRSKFTSRVEAQDTSFVVEDDDQCPDRVQDRRTKKRLSWSCCSMRLRIGDVEGNPVNTPGASIFQARRCGRRNGTR